MIGIDIEKIARFKKLPYKKNRDFYENIFTPKEIAYCVSHTNSYPHFAARFAGKEAVIKVLGKNIGMKKIEILNKKNGQPYVTLKSTRVRQDVHISLSHTDTYAVAVALNPVRSSRASGPKRDSRLRRERDF